ALQPPLRAHRADRPPGRGHHLPDPGRRGEVAPARARARPSVRPHGLAGHPATVTWLARAAGSALRPGSPATGEPIAGCVRLPGPGDDRDRLRSRAWPIEVRFRPTGASMMLRHDTTPGDAPRCRRERC